MNLALCDGSVRSVRFVTNEINLTMWRALATYDAGETINWD